MALVTTTEMFKKAYDGGYAVGAFNVNNMEIIQGITEAAGELKAPVILQVSKGARAYANHTYLVNLVEAAVIENPDIPIALHLDHGDSFELCKSCIDGGFTSVMIDASSKPFEENIEITKKVVEYAHARGVVVEAELGTLAGVEDEVKVAAEDSSYTRPEDVEEFVRRTGCDSLAIAIGTSHGAYKFKPEQCTRNEEGILVPPPLRFDILFKRFGGSVDHDRGESVIDTRLTCFKGITMVQMENDRKTGFDDSSFNQFYQVGTVSVGTGAFGNLQDNRSVAFLRSFCDSLDDLHVVDIESTDSVSAFVGFFEHFF